jgi:hypothetical protein
VGPGGILPAKAVRGTDAETSVLGPAVIPAAYDPDEVIRPLAVRSPLFHPHEGDYQRAFGWERAALDSAVSLGTVRGLLFR